MEMQIRLKKLDGDKQTDVQIDYADDISAEDIQRVVDAVRGVFDGKEE